jgi:hypothetical protein
VGVNAKRRKTNAREHAHHVFVGREKFSCTRSVKHAVVARDKYLSFSRTADGELCAYFYVTYLASFIQIM